jgi:hypothetical protein
LIVKYNVVDLSGQYMYLEEHEIDYLWLDDGEICCCLAMQNVAMCWSVWHYRTWSRWHLWLPIFTLGQELFRLVCYVEKSQGQLCAYMYNTYNLKSNCTCLPLLQKWTSSEIIMKKFKFFYSVSFIYIIILIKVRCIRFSFCPRTSNIWFLFHLLIQLDLSQRYHFQVQKITCMQLEIISLIK